MTTLSDDKAKVKRLKVLKQLLGFCESAEDYNKIYYAKKEIKIHKSSRSAMRKNEKLFAEKIEEVKNAIK